MTLQRCVGTGHVVTRERAVIAGPHAWEVGGVRFSTVLVKCDEDTKRGAYSVILQATGVRIGHVAGVMAPKTRPHEAMQAVSRMLDALQVRCGAKGAAIVGGRIGDEIRNHSLPKLEA